MITAPFNFVPLSKEVFFPNWSDMISHDVPFKDGESGIIDITITAKSPLFIRDAKEEARFCQHNGEYYIPATSIKGMVRNVLETLSFSKMSKDSFNDDTYAVRDLSNSSNFYMTEMKENIFCGWLYKDGNNYKIQDCGEPYRISHKEIDKALNVSFSTKFEKNGFEKTSEYKYNIINGPYQQVTIGEPYKSKTNAKYDKRLFCRYEPAGKIGTLVLTGQPTVRKNSGKMGDGKGFEFVFIDKENNKNLVIEKNILNNFLFAYFDKRDTEPKESPDWKYWKKKLENDEKVPVFFKKKGNLIAHFGLSYLYKLPYSHSVKDGVPKSHEDDRLDLAQTIFGHTNKDNSLKGRVQFSHFKAVSNIKELDERVEILGTPRASYYPIYVKQKNGKLFTTFMDEGFEISGRKRYPIHSSLPKNNNNERSSVSTSFFPLKEGVVFKGKLRYHNLKKAELGAILSALTFHNNDKCYHNIGFAKSLGYGKIETTLHGMAEIGSYIKEFELQLASQINNWHESDQIKELLTMATPQNNEGNSKLRYMELKEFADNKSKTKDYLKPYTELENIKTFKIDSLISSEEKLALKAKREEELKRAEERKRQKEEEQKIAEQKQLQTDKYNEALNSDNTQLIENFINKYPDDENIQVLKDKLTSIKQEQQLNKHKKVEETAQYAFNAMKNQKDRDKFIKKWSMGKHNKGSEVVLSLVEQASKIK